MTTKTIPNPQALYNAMSQLVNIMAALRHPVTGCPWDIEQTFATIAHYTIEEAYEVVDSIEENDLVGLRDELGDLLLQVIFHARMAQEQGAFHIIDVIDSINAKMVSRHPHVFGDKRIGDDTSAAVTADTQSVNWEEQKALERSQKNAGKASLGALDGVAKALPALMRAQKLQKRAARVGFDWPTAQDALQKIEEEAQELIEASTAIDEGAMAEEAGDLLFSCVNVVRKLGVDAEAALRAANSKFVDRFVDMETQAKTRGEALQDLDLKELEALWRAAKSATAQRSD